MNPKVLVAAAVAGLAVLVGAIGLGGSYIINDVSEGGLLRQPEQPPPSVEPLQISLGDISILEISERAAVISFTVEAYNPNYKSVILQFVTYELYEGGQRIAAGEIGDRPDSFVTSSNYFTLLPDKTTNLSETVTVKNTGNTPRLWEALSSGSPDWTVSGEAFYNLSSMTSGGENTVRFELGSSAGT